MRGEKKNMKNETKKTTKKKTSMKDIITDILVKHPKTRSNDIELIIWYCKKTKKSTDLKDWVNDGVNTLETIRRTRQKLQQENKNLRAPTDTERARREREKMIREYMLG